MTENNRIGVTLVLLLALAAAVPATKARAQTDPSPPGVLGSRDLASTPREDCENVDGPLVAMDIAFFDNLLTARMRSMIFAEATELFRCIGIEVAFIDRIRNPSMPARRYEAKVVLMARAPAGWKLREDVMGAVMGGARGTVYVFYPAVLKTLARYRSLELPVWRSAHLGTENLDVARAIARVMAHEIVHTLAPGLGHSTRGLMQEEFELRDLVARRVHLDPAFSAALKEGLGAALAENREHPRFPQEQPPRR